MDIKLIKLTFTENSCEEMKVLIPKENILLLIYTLKLLTLSSSDISPYHDTFDMSIDSLGTCIIPSLILIIAHQI